MILKTKISLKKFKHNEPLEEGLRVDLKKKKQKFTIQYYSLYKLPAKFHFVHNI
jgi:hypothetical protein